MTRVKICGLTLPEDARHAERVGASYLGAILASGPRLVDVTRARAVLGPRRSAVQRVAVFGDRTPAEIAEVADALDLDVMQLHGDPTAAFVRDVQARSGRTVWPVVRVEGTTLPSDAVALAEAARHLVLDAKVVGQLGGTGVALDWPGLVHAVTALRARVPDLVLILAGGLRPDNVAQAIALLAPDVVDVSSGVEASPGVKDPDAIERFVSAATAAKGLEDDAR